ncbi:MAG: hypothetical protein JHC33_05145 [Ignisphaera sp.]|nr:hypothetical protein [Ignisphaera sp.]
MLFEYKCSVCNQTVEKLEHYSAPEVRDCEICGSIKSACRIISRTSFVLDNSGWYKQAYTKG